MTKLLRTAAPLTALALVALAGCKPTTVTAGSPIDPTADQVKAAPPVKLPPALVASKSYRCKDNSLIYVDWFNDGTTANLKTKKDGEVHHLTAEASGKPFMGDNLELTGTPTEGTVTFKGTGGSQACTG